MLVISIRLHRPRTWGTEPAAACTTCQNLIDARVRAYRFRHHLGLAHRIQVGTVKICAKAVKEALGIAPELIPLA